MNKEIIELLKANIIYILFITAVVIGGIYLLIPKGKTFLENRQQLITKQEEVDNLQRELDTLKEMQEKKAKQQEKEQKELKDKDSLEKPIFKTNVQSNDAFSANAPLFEDIIKLLKSNKLKLISIENKASGFEDEIANGTAGQYNSCMITMQILGSYPHFQKFLTYLYNYPYLINISSIDAIPYDKDKKTLIINLSIILYSETVQDSNVLQETK